MALEISDFTGTTTAPSGTWPYGDVINAPGGTVVDNKMVSDLIQTSQKILADGLNGVAINGLLDNATNGFQVYNALRVVTGTNFEVSPRTTMDGDTLDFSGPKFVNYSAASTNINLTIDMHLARPGNKLTVRTPVVGGGLLLISYTNSGGGSSTTSQVILSDLIIAPYSNFCMFQFEYLGAFSGTNYYSASLFGI